MNNQFSFNTNKYEDLRKEVDDLKVDLIFSISKNFYYTEEQFKAKDFNIDFESTELKPHRVIYSGEKIHSVLVLGSDLKKFSQRNDLNFLPNDKAITITYWSVSPVLYSKKAEMEINFWIGKNLLECRRILEDLSQDGEGVLYDNLDQGWHVHAARKDDKFIIWQDMFDIDRFIAAMSTDFSLVSPQIKEAMDLLEYFEDRLNGKFDGKVNFSSRYL